MSERKQTQISAFVAEETKARLDRYTRETGARKGHVIEQALDEYLTSHDEVPLEYAIPREITLTSTSFARVLELIESPPEPSEALRLAMERRT